MKTWDLSPTQFSVGDLLQWQREGLLNLNPDFQRRSVWKPEAKSLLIDTVVRGLPMPLIFLHARVDLNQKATIRDVVDGQQRLRTIFSYIDPGTIPDFDVDRDLFQIKQVHNSEIAGRSFDELPKEYRVRILDYKFSVQTLPAGASRREILEIFARLNSTGQRLNHQELRNAAYFGEFKTAMYDLAYDQLDRWIGWGVLTPDQLTRMIEVETTSDLVLNIMYGLSGKSQRRIDNAYRDYDEDFPKSNVVRLRFREVMDSIDEYLGRTIPRTIFTSDVHFFTLFVYMYDAMYGLDSALDDRPPNILQAGLEKGVAEVSRRFREWEVPPDVLDAVTRASSDLGRRETRLSFMQKVMKDSLKRSRPSKVAG